MGWEYKVWMLHFMCQRYEKQLTKSADIEILNFNSSMVQNKNILMVLFLNYFDYGYNDVWTKIMTMATWIHVIAMRKKRTWMQS